MFSDAGMFGQVVCALPENGFHAVPHVVKTGEDPVLQKRRNFPAFLQYDFRREFYSRSIVRLAVPGQFFPDEGDHLFNRDSSRFPVTSSLVFEFRLL